MGKRSGFGDVLVGEHYDDGGPARQDAEIAAIAYAFNKPYLFTERCLKAHDVKLPLPKFRTPDDGLGPFYSDMTSHFDLTPSRTKQEFTAECDINNIMKRYRDSDFDISTLPLTSRQAKYGDFTGLPESYHAAVNFVKGAQAQFMTLDADIRALFENDPQKFLNYLDDPTNKDHKKIHAELVERGIVDSPDGGDLSPAGGAASSSEAKPAGGKSFRDGSSALKASKADSEGEEGE